LFCSVLLSSLLFLLYVMFPHRFYSPPDENQSEAAQAQFMGRQEEPELGQGEAATAQGKGEELEAKAKTHPK
jgi:hypothetical protein